MASVSVNSAEQILRLPEDGLPYLRHNRASEQTLRGGSFAVSENTISQFEQEPSAALQIDASGWSVIPGFIDSHTHLPFIGWRAQEYAAKVAGASYEEIALNGGGIRSSAKAFAEATDSEVLAQSKVLAEEMLRHGTLTFECKSGYGLTIENELRALKLAAQLGEEVPQRTVSTALLAHAIPKDMTADGWLAQVQDHCHSAGVGTAKALDIYVESFAFSNDHLQLMGQLAQEYNLALRCHVEQFNNHRSVPIAIAAGARSVDHLSCMHPDDVALLGSSECAAVLLPGAEFMGNERTPRARELARAGAICVLATDLNPGTSPVLSIPLIIGLAARRYSWTIKEVLLATTLNAAWVLGLSETTGSLEIGKRADFLLLDGPVEDIPYRFGRNPVAACFIDGVPVYIRDDAQERITDR